MSSSNSNPSVSRGGAGEASTTTTTSSGTRNRPEVTRGADEESVMDKIRRTGLDAGRGGDVSADNPTRGGSNLVGKAAHTTSNLKDEAKGMMSRHRMGMGGLGAGSTAGRRSSRVMSGPEMTNDFLKNYSFEIKSEIGESEPGDGIRR